MSIYFDNASTTKPCKEAIEAVNRGLSELWGNPSSLHSMGVKAQLAVDESRKIIADSIGCESRCIYFTSGATESSNMALKGSAMAYGKRKRRIVTSSVEHSSVKESINELEKSGFEVVRISPDKNGIFNPDDFINAVDENTCLVSVMLVNNETGYILPVKKVFSVIKRRFPDVVTHCDCVQGFMKIPVKVRELNADLISLSGHKIHSAKGVGALYIKKGIRLIPVINGGKQENGIRSGTESVPLIMGFGASVKALSPHIEEHYRYVSELKKYLCSRLSELDYISVNSKSDASPYIVNISVSGIRSEIMLHWLENHEIYVSSGSACSKGAKSGVLDEFGLSQKLADSALRISLDFSNTKEEIDKFVDVLKEGQQKILKSK
ncbi:MAG: cysteine desulfurase family protein [Oscillospiraceae bacterium]|nr:cysteine desulfurase family protein [Oscillospiraceae bacterium]